MKVAVLPALALFASASLADTAYVLPVAAAKVKDRVYTTTIAVKNPGDHDVPCELIYALPSDPNGGTMRTHETIPAGGTQVYEDMLVEEGAIGTVRLLCTADVISTARIQSSMDGGKTFDEGRVFEGVSEADPITAAKSRSIITDRDLLAVETLGKPLHFKVVVRNDGGVVWGEKKYELPPFAQQIINLSKVLVDLHEAHVEITVVDGDGGIGVTKVSRDPELAKMAQRLPSEQRAAYSSHQQRVRTSTVATTSAAASVPSVTSQLLAASFKAGAFQEPFTGLVYMRDRWYNPRTGSFLTPDPEGYADSANLYSYCHGDPVNCTDPTGRLGDGGDLRADFREKENAERARRAAAWCRANPVECRKRDVRGAAILKGIGAAGQTAAGVTTFLSTGPIPEPVTKTIGGVTTARGIENLGTAAVELWTGEERSTPTGHALYLALRKAGKTPTEAARTSGWTETGVDIGLTFGASAASAYNAWRAPLIPEPWPSIPLLDRGPGGRMLGQALKLVKAAPAAERPAMMREMLAQIEARADAQWAAREVLARNGSTAWVGDTHTLVIDAQGNIFKGTNMVVKFGMRNGQIFVEDYSALTEF